MSIAGRDVGFTGTRQGMTSGQRAELRELLMAFGQPGGFHHGDCIGADTEAGELARGLGWKLICHPPLSDFLRGNLSSDVYWQPKAYLERNKQIVEATPLLFAAPAERSEQLRSGTWSTVRYARKLSKVIYMLLPEAKVISISEHRK